MKGDYHRYMAKFKVGDEPKEAAEDTMNSYKAAHVRKGRMPGKTTELENLEANIFQKSCSWFRFMLNVSSAGFDDGVVNDELEKMARAFVAGAYSNSSPLPLTALLVQIDMWMSCRFSSKFFFYDLGQLSTRLSFGGKMKHLRRIIKEYLM